MSNRPRFATLIRAGRLALDPPLTQEALAEKLGRTQASVSAWEAGKQLPGLDVLHALSTELGIPADDLLEAAAEATAAEAIPA